MSKTVIVISGLMDTGKTTTIRKFYGLLLKKYPEITEIYSRDNGSDIQRILDLYGLKIGINSIGDPDTQKNIDRRFEKLWKEEECDIIVCATRTEGKTLNAVKGLNKVLVGLNLEKYKIIQFSNLHSWQKENTDTLNYLNDESAKFLLNIFEYSLIKNNTPQGVTP